MDRVGKIVLAACMCFTNLLNTVYAEESVDQENSEEDTDVFGFSGEARQYLEGELEYSLSDMTIRVTVTSEAKLPADTILRVKEIREDSHKQREYDEYQNYLEQAKEAVKEEDGSIVQSARFFDISFEADGEVIEPFIPVDVQFEYADAVELKEGTSVKAVHLPKEKDNQVLGTEINAGIEKNENSVETISFTANSFSVYGVVYTVDFWYGEYEYHLNGEGEILVSELLKELEILGAAGADTAEGNNSKNRIDSMEDVISVTFSNDELVKVEKVEGQDGSADWNLISLKAFDSEEKLTVETKAGVIEIRVTDAASASEFVSIPSNSVITNAVGNSRFPVYYAFDNGAIVSGDEIGMPTTLKAQRINTAATVVSAGADKTAFQAAWNAALGTDNVGVTVNRAWAENNTLQIQLAFTAENGHVYYSSQYGTTNSDNNTNNVRTEINTNRYMLAGEDKIVVRLTLANNNNAHYSANGITYGSTQNSVVKAFATSLDADTYGSNMLPATVSIAGVPYTVVDNITTFKQNSVTYTLDRANQRATITSGTTDVGSVNVNGTVFVIPRQNEYSGTINYKGVTYTVDTSRTDGRPIADASAYRAATIGAGTNRTIIYKTDYGQNTSDPTVINNITVSIPLSKTIQSTLPKENFVSELSGKMLTFGVTQGNDNPSGGATVSLTNGGEGTDYTMTYDDLFTNGTNTGSNTDTSYTLDGINSPWKATFTKEGTYTFIVSEKDTGHTGIVNQSEAVTLTYYIVEEAGSLRLAEIYKAKDAEVASTKVTEANLENLNLTRLFNTSYALGTATRKPPEITALGETITMNLHEDTSGVITTKFTFDFSRSFEITGQLGTPDSDAVAISFHGYDALPAYRWDCNNGFDDFHYGNGNKQKELRFLRYGYIPPNGDLITGFLYNIITRDLDSLRGWYAYKVENNVRLPYIASSGLNGDVRNTDGTYEIVPDAKSYESFDNDEENWKNDWSPFKVKFTCRNSANGLGTLEITAMGKTVQFDDFNASDILGADVWQHAHFSLGSSVQNGDHGGLIFSEAKYTDGLDSVDTTFWADRDHNGVYETQVNTTNSLAVPGETILVRHTMNRTNSSGELFFENVLIRQMKDITNGNSITAREVVSYPYENMSTAYEADSSSTAFNTDDITQGMRVAVFQGQSTVLEYKITAPSEYNHTVAESALFGQPPFISIYTGADGFRTQKELKWETPTFTNNVEVVNVTYNPDGGTFADNSTANKVVPVLSGSTFTPSEEPTRTDWDFAGWKLDGTDTVYQTTDSFTVNSDVALVAQWTQGADLKILKRVSGGMADPEKEFAFKVTVEDAESGAVYKYTRGEDTTELQLIDNTGTFKLKDKEYITIKVPRGKVITITETSAQYYSTSVTTQTGNAYDTAPAVGSDAADKESDTKTITCKIKMDANNAGMTITNTLDDIAPTGVSPISHAFILILLTGAAITIGRITLRRKRIGA